jgi:hypothetical protein
LRLAARLLINPAKTLAKRRAQRHRARLVRVREDDEGLLAVTVGLRRNYRLRTTMRVADEFCAPTENSTGFEIFDNNRETKSIVQRLSNPMMLFRDITEVNSTMVIGHGVITFRIGVLADEFKCRARSKVFIGILAAINSGGRFVAQFCNPARV